MKTSSVSGHQYSLGAFWGTLGALCFAFLMLLNRQTKSLDVPVVVWGRCFFASLTILPFLRLDRPFALWHIQLGRGLSATVAMLCTYYSYRLLSVSEAALLGTAGPLFISLLAVVLLKERVTWYHWLLFFLGYAGTCLPIVMDVFSFHGPLKYKMLVLGSNFFNGLVIVGGRYLTLQKIPTQNTLFYGTAIPMVIFTVMLPFVWKPLGGQEWLVLTILGLLGAGSAGFYLVGLRYAPASFLSGFEYLRTVFLLVIAYFVFQEIPGKWKIIGATMTVTSSAILTLMQKKQA